MRIWALSDLHLSLSVDKPMHVFGDHWIDHHERMAEAWDAVVEPEDVVLTPGDFSWAMKSADAGVVYRSVRSSYAPPAPALTPPPTPFGVSFIAACRRHSRTPRRDVRRPPSAA
jgi:3',5'-cyclic AMP phosphodiesterase CpdA